MTEASDQSDEHSSENEGDEFVPLVPPTNPLDSESVEDELDGESLPPEVRMEIQRLVKRVVAWAAPFPPPELGQEYNSLRGDTFDIIVDDFERTSKRADRLADHQIELENRQMSFLEREQDLRIKQSDDDVATRRDVLRRGFITELILIGLVFFVVFFGDLDGWATVAISTAILSPLLITRGNVLLRGRISDNEVEVLRNVLPKIRESNNQSPDRSLQNEDSAE